MLLLIIGERPFYTVSMHHYTCMTWAQYPVLMNHCQDCLFYINPSRRLLVTVTLLSLTSQILGSLKVVHIITLLIQSVGLHSENEALPNSTGWTCGCTWTVLPQMSSLVIGSCCFPTDWELSAIYCRRASKDYWPNACVLSWVLELSSFLLAWIEVRVSIMLCSAHTHTYTLAPTTSLVPVLASPLLSYLAMSSWQDPTKSWHTSCFPNIG